MHVSKYIYMYVEKHEFMLKIHGSKTLFQNDSTYSFYSYVENYYRNRRSNRNLIL